MPYATPEFPPEDLPSILRDSILSDVRCFGKAELCTQRMSDAFADFNMQEMNQWCEVNNLAIITTTDGLIVIRPAMRFPPTLSATFEFDLPPEVLAYYRHVFGEADDRTQLIRAEVEAMDWPEVIGE
jgi:hypothetical protein